MAGYYSDAPSVRIPYDRDGTVYIWTQGAGTYTALQSELDVLNNESADVTWTGNSTPFGYRPGGVKTGFIFPQLMDISHLFLGVGNNDSISAIEFSMDTTNLIDGTWTSTPVVGKEIFSSVKPGYRELIAATSAPIPNGIKSLRFTTSQADGNRYIRVIHMYGNITAGENPDRLRMWHPTLDEPLDDPNTADGSYFDWGDVQQSSTQDKTFRIKNNSATQTANSIQITQEALTDAAQSLPPQFTFSDGGVFSATIDIGNLAPGALSSVITKRYTLPSNATFGLWTSRTVADAGSWT